MKKRLLSLCIALCLIVGTIPLSVLALDGEIDVTGNLLKITTSADFNSGTLDGLQVNTATGDGAVALQSDALIGTFTSPVYSIKAVDYLVASWNSSMYEGASLEILARVYVEAGAGEEAKNDWTSWLGWGEFSQYVKRGNTADVVDTAHNWAFMDQDTLTVKGASRATKVQMKAVLTRSSASVQSPVLRQITLTYKCSDGSVDAAYGEKTEDISKLEKTTITAPAYSQLIRDPDIGGSICSPTTISVLLNSRNSALDILPEELALNALDMGNGIFGNWSYCVSAAGLYGYEAYAQYANRDILLQELAKGHTVGISVKYSTDSNSTYYLEGAYGSTNGHLISLVGFYYEDGHIGDSAYLHVYSSDSYSKTDETSFHDYKWSQLEKCWTSRMAYILPAVTPEAGAVTTGVTRVDATLNSIDSTTYAMMNGTTKINLTDFTSGKMGTMGAGVLAYTVEGFAAGELVDSSVSVKYPQRLTVTANQTFYYNDIGFDSDGNLVFNGEEVLKALSVGLNDTRTITIYAMANNGYRYTTQLDVTRTGEGLVVVPMSGTTFNTYTMVSVTGSDGTVRGTLTAATIEQSQLGGKTGYWVTPGILIPQSVNHAAAKVYVGTTPFAGTYTQTGFKDTHTSAEGGLYAALPLDAAAGLYYITVEWKPGMVSSYQIDLSTCIKASDYVQAGEGNLLRVDLTEGKLSGGAMRNEKGQITLSDGATDGSYLSPIYKTPFAFEYMEGSLSAATYGNSSAKLMVRVRTQTGGWSGWFTWGNFGSGIASMSSGAKDDYVNMNDDLLSIRGDSSTANAYDVQLRVDLTLGSQKKAPVLFGVSATYKKAAYNTDEAVYTGKTQVADLPASAIRPLVPSSAYGHASGMSAYRFENMVQMMLNAQGADLLFEEVALSGYDFNIGWGNWAYTGFKPGLFGYEAYTQFGTSAQMIQQALADGNVVGAFVNGAKIPSTNGSSSSITLVYGYYTKDDGTVIFKVCCPRGDANELANGDILGEATAAQLDEAISSYGGSSVRGMMYVVGQQVVESAVTRKTAAAQQVDDSTYTLYIDGQPVALPADFVSANTDLTGKGVLAYTLNSELRGKALPTLAERTFHYDLTLTAKGDLQLSDDLKTALAAGDAATLYVIYNNGVTYTATLVSTETLAQIKTAAGTTLEAAVDPALYTGARLTALQAALAAGKQAIADAKSPEAVNDALEAALTALRALPTDAVALTAAKAAAKTALDALKSGKYTAQQQAKINAILEKAAAAAENAATVEAVEAIVAQAKLDVQAVIAGKSPATGDSTPLAALICMLCVSAGAAVLFIKKRKEA